MYWVEQHPPQIPVFLEPGPMTWLGNGVFTDVVKLRGGHTRLGSTLNTMTRVLRRWDRHTQGKATWGQRERLEWRSLKPKNTRDAGNSRIDQFGRNQLEWIGLCFWVRALGTPWPLVHPAVLFRQIKPGPTVLPEASCSTQPMTKQEFPIPLAVCSPFDPIRVWIYLVKC